MIITEISVQKNKGRHNLFVDDAFYSGIDDEVIVLYGLKVGQEIEEKKLEDLVISSEKRRAFEKLVDLISRKEYSEREIKDKLIKKGYNIKGIELATNMAKEYGYIDDFSYAKTFVANCGKKSLREIKNKLFLKGVNKETIDEALNDISDEQEQENASFLAEKYLKNKQLDKKTLAGLYAYLARKGFESSVCRDIIRKVKLDVDD